MTRRTSRNRELLGVAALLAMAGYVDDIRWGRAWEPRHSEKTKEDRPCLNCGKMHLHNNSYCSAECCKAYRAKGKNNETET